MFEDVPEPVWKTSIGNWSSSSPAATRSPAAAIRSAFSASSSSSSAFTRAAAALIRPSQRATGGGIGSPETGKLSTAFRVSAPQSSCPVCTSLTRVSLVPERAHAARAPSRPRTDIETLTKRAGYWITHRCKGVCAPVRPADPSNRSKGSPMRRKLKLILVFALLAAAATAAIVVAATRGRESERTERQRELAHILKSGATPGRFEKVERGGEASREIANGPAQEEYANEA